MNMKIKAPAIKLGNNIDTDVILPGQYMTLVDPYELAKHALSGLDLAFPEKAKKGVIVVGGKNFGCGSSREQAPLALKYAGVKCVLAESFARIFYRNAINVGLLPVVCPQAGAILEGTEVMVDLDGGYLVNEGKKLPIEPIPEFLRKIIDAGGLVEFAREVREVPVCTGSQP